MTSRVSAVGRRNRERVVVIDVAQPAGHVGMTVGQGEAGRIVIEYSGRPGRNRMACGASRSRRRKSRRDVIGNVSAERGGALKCRLVTPVAIRGTQRVVVVHMAGCARSRRRRHVRSG